MLSLDDLLLFKALQDKNSHLADCVRTIDKLISPILNRIASIFMTYTLHDVQHSYRVIKYMGDLIDDIAKISDVDILLLILSGLFHDIGMFATKKELNEIKDMKNVAGCITYASIYKVYGDEVYAMQEYLRMGHATRSGIVISKIYESRKDIFNFFVDRQVQNVRLIKILSNICCSHEKDFQWILVNLSKDDVISQSHFNQQFIAFLLRIADLLDIDEFRAPTNNFDTLKLDEVGETEWLQHYIIANDNKVTINPKTQEKEIVFYGECENPKIHRKILKYIRYIEAELQNCNSYTDKFDAEYIIRINSKIKNKISTQGFIDSELRFNLDYQSITHLLMGENIYGDKKYGLRELIQNSIDACKIKEEIIKEKDKEEKTFTKYNPCIALIINKEENEVVIQDNGIGMDDEILLNYFLNVGVSYYQSNKYKYLGLNYEPIGKFGIGFLACFMLSDKVKIETQKQYITKKYIARVDRYNEFVSLNIEDNGTDSYSKIYLKYNEFISVFDNDINNAIQFIGKHFISENDRIVAINDGEVLAINNPLYDSLTVGDKVIDIAKYDCRVEGQVIMKGDNPIIDSVLDLPLSNNAVFYDRILENYYDISFLLEDIWDEFKYDEIYAEDDFIDEEDSQSYYDWKQGISFSEMIDEKEIYRIYRIINENFPNGELEMLFRDALSDIKKLDNIDKQLLKGIYDNNKFHWFNVPLVYGVIVEDFMEILDSNKDFEKTVNLFKNEIEWLSIITSNLDDLESLSENYKDIAEEYGHMSYCPTKLYHQEIDAWEVNREECTYLAYSNKNSSYYNRGVTIDNCDVYVKDVLLEKAYLIPDILLCNCTVDSIRINIKREVSVNVARNDLDNASQEKLELILSRIILEWLTEKETKEENKVEFRKFIDNILTE